MEPQTEQITVAKLADIFKDKANQLNSDASMKTNFLKMRSEDNIKKFKEQEEVRLKGEIEEADIKAREKYQFAVDEYLKELLKVIEPFEGKSRFTKAEDELVIDVFNVYKETGGFFLGTGARNAEIIERKLTIMYELNIERWRNKFGQKKIIEKTLTNFFSSIPMYHKLVFEDLGKNKSVKKVEKNYKVVLYNEVSKLRQSDETLNESFIWLKNLPMQKNQMVIEKKYEKAAELRDSEKIMREKIFESLKDLLPDTVADTDILSVISEHIK